MKDFLKGFELLSDVGYFASFQVKSIQSIMRSVFGNLLLTESHC